MDKKAVLEDLARFRDSLEATGIGVDKLILYGSYASGQAREGSDFDVIVISKDFEKKGYWERIDLLSSAIYKTFLPIEAVGLTPEEWEKEDSLIVDFARHGEVLHSD
jgi:predicted nucleotidyltransferase